MKLNKTNVLITLLTVVTVVALLSVTGIFNLPLGSKWLLGVPVKWSITCWPL